MRNWKSDLLAIKKNLVNQAQLPNIATNQKGTVLVLGTTSGKPAERPGIPGSTSGVQLRTAVGKGSATKKSKVLQPAKSRPQPPALSSIQKLHPASAKRNASDLRPAVPQPVANSSRRTQISVSKPGQGVPPAKAQIALPLPVPASIKALRKISVERQKFFRDAAEWVTEGAQTQLSHTAEKGRSIDVVIGVDFGTSYTKAAVGMLDKIYPVNWSGVTNSSEPLLLPSEYTVLPDGKVFLGQRPGALEDEVRLDIKLPFINPGVSIKSVATASVFLAQVLRYVRAWVYKFHGTKIGDAKIRWQFNLGAPCNGLEDPRLTTAFRRLGYTAWLLSQRGVESGMTDAVEITEAWQNQNNPPDLSALDVFPEFVAQMAGYVQSPQRQRGLHALADVGGGTLDVVTFIVHQVDHEDTFPFLVPEVKSLGTHMLNQNRIVGVGLETNIELPDELMPVLDAESFATATSIDPAHVKSRDRIFCAQVSDVVKKVMAVTKAKRYRQSEAWSTGLRTFLTGGGASVEGYDQAIKSGGLACASRIDLILLPLHPRIADFTGRVQDYQRISVACGLAQDAFSLGRIIAAKDVEDDYAIASLTRVRPDRDELYAK